MLYSLHENLEKIPRHARVIFRVDANITPPVTQANDFRLQAFLPSLQILLKKECTITLITHCDKPKNENILLSTIYVTHWLEQQEIVTLFASNLEQALQLSEHNPGVVIVLENIRFFPEEQQANVSFARILSRLGDYYVTDAFGTLHDNDTSVVLLPKLYDADHRSIGLLIERELKGLNKLLKNPAHPYYAIIGGGKPETKLPLLISLSKQTDKILTMPLLDTVISHEHINNPQDYLVCSMDKQLHSMSAQDVPEQTDLQRISIGPKTVEQYTDVIAHARTIFCNGLSGFADRPETLIPSIKLLQAMATSNAYTVLAGGDTVALAYQAGLADKMSFCSTGGGATLQYIAGEKLPGLEVFI